MKTVRLALAAAVVAFMTVVAPTPAQAYPGLSCNISDVDHAEEGEDFTVTATVDPSVPSDWELTYDGQSHSDTNTTSTSATFEATDDTTVVAVVTQAGNSSTCVGRVDFGDGDDGDDGDDDGDGGGILPNTGGERLLWLIIGGLLVMTGGGVVMASRRRDA